MASPLLTLFLASAWLAVASAIVVGTAAKNTSSTTGSLRASTSPSTQGEVGTAAKNASSTTGSLRASTSGHAQLRGEASVPAASPSTQGEVPPTASLATAGQPYFDCKAMFKGMDNDTDGYVTKSEERKYFAARGITVDRHVAEEHEEADSSHGGRLSEFEFLRKCCEDMGCPPEQDPTYSAATLVDSRALLTRRTHSRAAYPKWQCKMIWKSVNINKDKYVTQTEAVDFINENFPVDGTDSDKESNSFYRECFRKAGKSTYQGEKAASKKQFEGVCKRLR